MSSRTIIRARRPAVLALVAVVILFLGTVPTLAVSDNSPRNFDARVDLNRGLELAPTAEQARAIEALRNSTPSLGATIDPATGATRSLNNQMGYLTASDPGVDPGSIAAAFIGASYALLGLTPQDVAHFDAETVFSQATGATRIYLRQSHQEIPVYNGQLQLNINRDGRILSIRNAFLPDLAAAANTSRPVIDAKAAIDAAFEHLDGVAGEATEGRLMWLPIRRGEARLVWNLQIATANSQHHYDLNVDAASGQVWTRFDWVVSDSYRVYAAPVESPNHTTPLPPSDARSLEANPEHATASPSGWFDAGVTIMDGNNVHACLDTNANNVCDAGEPNCAGPAPLSCDFAIDLTQQPSASQAAAVANLFYWNNTIHDTQYLYGFDEASGNFQEDNFGAGGAGSDSVNADAQDGSGNCNANFGTPSDGNNPRMQMFTCTNGTPDRDGDFDNIVIVHEYAHGISNRLVGGPNNVSCLGNAQQAGEGWSDLLGLIYTHQAGFGASDARGVGSYLFDEPAVGGGIRTFPYSTSFAVNPDTYSTIGSRSIPHGVGSVWAEIAWEAYWEVVSARGFDPDLQNIAANAGNHRMMLYFTEGLKNTACSPTFIDARDGVIEAAIDNGVEDVCLLWRGFARRGLGTDASTSGPNSTTATDGFSVPAQCEPAVCPSGVCEFGEDCTTCPADCSAGGGSGAVCGNGVCEAGDGESCLTCAADCDGKQNGKPADRFCCGDGIAGEGAVDCADSRCTAAPFMCTNTPVPPSGSCCGDFLCEGAEDDVICAIDCPGGGGMVCAPQGDSCTVDGDCCSLKCKGPSGGKICK